MLWQMWHEKSDMYIEAYAELEAYCALHRHDDWLAIDTEFQREDTYFPKLCLVQIATANSVACIDTQAIKDLSALHQLLCNTGITKVIHSARQDLEILFHLWDEVPGPVFDTQIAAAMLGYADQIGYAALVSDILGIELGKSHTRSDWTRRPLSAEQLQYAADDVRHLARLYPLLRDRLTARGRLEWLQEESVYLTQRRNYVSVPAEAWHRIGGAHKLRGDRLAALQVLAAWREETARTEDKPRSWILKDDSVLEIARLMPHTLPELANVRNINKTTLQHHADVLLALIQEVRSASPQTLPEHRFASPLDSAQKALAELLLTVVRLRAAQLEITPALLASRKEVERLVRGDQEVSLLHGWRKQAVGVDLLAVLRGEETLQVRDGEIEIIATARNP